MFFFFLKTVAGCAQSLTKCGCAFARTFRTHSILIPHRGAKPSTGTGVPGVAIRGGNIIASDLETCTIRAYLAFSLRPCPTQASSMTLAERSSTT
ncbi:hypothetical protein H4582DRAFT_1190894 [Lactarius indigo]|nr:hypothetical protein H4582DRAFT_1190894 [Lactarius indigo]